MEKITYKIPDSSLMKMYTERIMKMVHETHSEDHIILSTDEEKLEITVSAV